MRSWTASFVAAGLACGLTLLAVGPAAGQPPRTKLGELFRTPPGPGASPVVGRYAVERGPGFVLDRSNSSAPLLKYENREEVFVLQPRPVGRGDMVFTNDAGEVVLRATRLGGLIVFTEDRPQGMAASLRGAAQPIPTEVQMSPGSFVRRIKEIGDRLADLDPNFKTVSFSSDDSAVAILAEAAGLTLQAVQTAVRKKKTKTVGALERLVLRDGPSPSVVFENGVMTITVTPGLGVAGRPSSEKIARALR